LLAIRITDPDPGYWPLSVKMHILAPNFAKRLSVFKILSSETRQWICIKSSLKIQPHITRVSTLPCEILGTC